jgi:L-lactate dehydrogenase complex protein LldF
MKEFKHLSAASSLCGKCSEVCPVKIDIHKMLLLNRRDAADRKLNTKTENIGWYIWKKGMLNRNWMDMFGGNFKNVLLRKFFKKTWGDHRTLPSVSAESFSQQYQKENK